MRSNHSWVVLASHHDRKAHIYQPMHTYPALDEEGNSVFIKSLDIQGTEFKIWMSLLQASADPSNHTMPVLKVLILRPDFTHLGYDLREDDTRAFVVMKTMNPTLQQWSPQGSYPGLASLEGLAMMTLQLSQVNAFRTSLRVKVPRTDLTVCLGPCFHALPKDRPFGESNPLILRRSTC